MSNIPPELVQEVAEAINGADEYVYDQEVALDMAQAAIRVVMQSEWLKRYVAEQVVQAMNVKENL